MSWLDKEVEGSEYKYLELPKVFQTMELEDPTPPSSSAEARRWSVEEEERFLFLVAQARSNRRQQPEVLRLLPWARFSAWLWQRLSRP